MTVAQAVRAAGRVLPAALLLAACGQQTASHPDATGGGTPSAALTVAALRAEIQPAAGATGKACPVAYDPAAAGKAAGVTGAAAPASSDPVEAVTSDSATAPALLKQVAPAVSLQCSYQLGSGTVHTLLIATSKADSALGAALPQVSFWSGADPAALIPFVTKARAAAPGTATVGPGGKAAVVRLSVAGGDGVLAVAVDTPQSISADQMTKLAETFAGQVH
jgi:hypothetical protein